MSMSEPEIDELNRPTGTRWREGQLVFQRCDCGHAWLPARRQCPRCLQRRVRWERRERPRPARELGRLPHGYHPAFEDRLPYNVALVELDEGPRLITNIVDPNESLAATRRSNSRSNGRRTYRAGAFSSRRPAAT